MMQHLTEMKLEEINATDMAYKEYMQDKGQ